MLCAHDKVTALSEVRPNPRNPNKHPREQVELLARVISTTGWRHPIVISTRSKLIVYGHARRLAAIQRGWTEVPIDYQDFKDEAEELSALVADNQIAELSEMERSATIDLLNALKAMGGDINLAGFTDDGLAHLIEEHKHFRDVPVRPPPSTVWILLAIPFSVFGEVREHVAALEERSEVAIRSNRD